ncbi:hypothetical protein SUGI_0574870 [Cryptomeria japonica]|uniref:subtilisin-like protease SBT1.7 n=1 Tax=Cryptomeria japonica TaxID=3369 RepID=UPI002408A9EC|nr:subtilisin-like protease SBT1.7 [Cryptomeria japonica]GLJ29156.1 hypothetical protein SUGI_0574870 [Cryptomeria japonica]
MASACVATFVLILASIFAISLGTPQGEVARKPYIVHVVKSAKPSHLTSHHKWYASMLHQVSQSDSHATELLYTYDTVLHGFAAMLSSAEAEAMETMDGCLAVIPASLHQLDTTHSPEFLGLVSSSGFLWNYSTYGEGIIVGVIDTGIWPESKSFSDAGLGPIPARWKGICEVGQKFNLSNCNKKIIGARYYFKGYEKSYNTSIDPVSEYKSARDSGGHGTHVASIVAGSPVDVSSWFGNGKARGMAPQARLAIYKACWKDGCTDADITAAIDQAIADGVDIISISISSKDVPFYKSTRAIAVFGAIKNGVLVSASGGNSGPFSSTLSNTLPWVMTVGASSIDRDFPAFVLLGNGATYRGTSTYKGGNGKLHGPFSVVYASANNSSKRCLKGSLDPNVVKGKIVLCDQLLVSKNPGESIAVEKGNEVARAGGVGMIVANEVHIGAQQRITNPINGLSSISVSFRVGERIKSYINRTLSNATAAMNITGLTVVGEEITAPMVAAFSSRGPSIAYPLILKPDMIAPGVNILAALGDGYEFKSGTSMAAPHVSGVAALIKAVHPKWSPAAIKSALMTSSYILDNAKQPIRDSYTMQVADPFAMGAGHIDPEAAVDPGLVYDMEPQDYINFLCSLNYTKQQIALLTNEPCPNSNFTATDLNYPSFSVVFNSGTQSVQVKNRTLTYVGNTLDVVYKVSVKSPRGVKMFVEPQQLKFKRVNEQAKYSVKFENEGTAKAGTVRFGEIMWNSVNGGKHIVRSPVIVAFQSSILSLDHSSSNTTYAFYLL